MVRLSVNVNKVATLRNSRGGAVPSVLEAVRACLQAGAPGITVHPRGDERHIRAADVREIAAELLPWRSRVELNIEGDPRDALLALVHEVKPDQCTLVPVSAGEVTSHQGWNPQLAPPNLAASVAALRAAGVRVSLFVAPSEEAVRFAHAQGADRVELYTEPYARAHAAGQGAARRAFAGYVAAATLAHELGMGVNAGHDLDLDNLFLFRYLPHLDEVSIGHALMSRALFHGLQPVVREYIALLKGV